jgi:hypothetical protein
MMTNADCGLRIDKDVGCPWSAVNCSIRPYGNLRACHNNGQLTADHGQFYDHGRSYFFRRDLNAPVRLSMTFDTFAATRPVVSATVVIRF